MQHDYTSPEILSENLPSSSTAIIPDMTVDDVDQEASTGLGALISDNSDVELGSHQVLGDTSERDIDDESRALGLEIIGEIPTEYPLIRSGVLKDPFRVFNMIYIPRAHGLLYDFTHALCDAMFIPDKEDKDRISVFAASLDPPQTWATLIPVETLQVSCSCTRSSVSNGYKSRPYLWVIEGCKDWTTFVQ